LLDVEETRVWIPGIVVCVGATLALSCTAQAATPSVVTGWPVVAASGSVHPGPGGGPVLIAEQYGVSSVAAFRLNGKRRWLSAYEPGCGNCNGGPETPGLQADGTYEPIGVEGDDFWGVDQQGARVNGCAGAVLADGTCIRHRVVGAGFSPGPSTPYPAVVALRGTTQLWEYSQPTLSWTIASNEQVPPVVYANPTTVYTSLGAGLTGQQPTDQQLIALNLSDGALRWRDFNVTPLAVLSTGVIGGTWLGYYDSGIVSYANDGTLRWTAKLPAKVRVKNVLVDEAHGRVYVSLVRVGGGGARESDVFELVALDAVTGMEKWRTRAVDRARPLSVGSNGLVYAGIDRDGRHALRAIGPDGKGRWQFDTATRVEGARLLPDGTVALSTGGPEGEASGLMWRIDPRRAASGVRSTRLTLSRTTFRDECGGLTCEYRSDLGTVMRIAVPRKATLRVRLLRPNESTYRGPITVLAPAGVSYVRLFAYASHQEVSIVGTRRRRIIDVRGTIGDRPLHVRFPVVIH
jgi:outer membrane protein assembly factor BamB